MTLKQLQVFLAVADTHSFSKAGEQVSLAQSTTSQHIKALEDEIGVRLFDRSATHVSLTAVGKLFYGHAQTIINDCDQSLAAIRSFQGIEQATVRVGASTIPAVCLIPDLLGQLTQEHPGIRLEVLQGDSQQVIQMLINDLVELAVVGACPDQPVLVSHKIMTDRIVLTARPEYADQRQITLQDLARRPLVVREQGSGTRQATDSALRKAGFDPKGFCVTAQLGSSEALRRAVLSGNVYAFISALAIEPELRNGSLVEIHVAGLEIQRDFYLTWRQHCSFSPAATVFMKLLTDQPPRASV